VFRSAVAFNQDLGRTWDVSSVTNMGSMFLGSPATDVQVCGASWKSNTAAQAEVAAIRMTFDSCTCEWRHSGDLWDCNIYDAVALWFSDQGSADAFYGPISAWNTVRLTSLEFLFGAGEMFYLVSSGTCQSNSYDEVPQVDCERAAIALGLGDTSVYVYTGTSSSYAARPEGCIYDGSYRVLLFNTMTTGRSCGADDYGCLCGVGTDFNLDISSWDVSSVTSMRHSKCTGHLL
jgi:hypothetical protein